MTALHERYGEEILLVQLFGSKARGDFDADSDLRVGVGHARQLEIPAGHQLSGCGRSLTYLVLAPKVISLARWEFLEREGFAIARHVRQEGVILAGVSM